MVMAKTNNLNAAMEELRNNYRQVLKEAVQYATKEAKKDVHNKALTCLEEYYRNYLPTSYDPRSDSLRHAFLPYRSVRSTGNYLVSTVGIEYSASTLDSYAGTSYNASKKYGRVDASWVIDNYLDGIHPTTDGSSIAGGAEYFPIYDAVSPTDKMKDFLTNYANTFDNNVYSYLAAYVVNKM